MAKPKLYFDTSVFGGIFDIEFQCITEKLFHMVEKGEVICLYSDLTEAELELAPPKVRDKFFELIKKNSEYLLLSEEVIQLAQKYVDENVVGKTSIDDCRHIATATLNKADFLVSWNFKHIVNVFRIRGYNSVNIKYGYSQIDIRSPKEIVTSDE